MMKADRNEATVKRFAAAWESRDLDAVMACFCDQAVYRSSTGPGPGKEAFGQSQVRKLVKSFFETSTARTDVAAELQAKESAVRAPISTDEVVIVFWNLIFPDPTGFPRNVEGLDVFTFDGDGRIKCKDAYRKAWS